MRWIAWVLAACAVFAASMGNAQAPAVKLALVIGNFDYDRDGRVDVSPEATAAAERRGVPRDLYNPDNDTRDINDTLTRIGFEVTRSNNLGAQRMRALIASFQAKVAAAPANAQVVIYYAGHAIQVGGKSYLIPIGATLPTIDYKATSPAQMAAILTEATVPMSEVMAVLRPRTAPGVNVVLLDACRNNPWEAAASAADRRLATTPAPRRTAIAYATQSGAASEDGDARNSAFARALATWILRPVTVDKMLENVAVDVGIATSGRQTPVLQMSNVGDACLTRCADASARGQRPPSAASLVPSTLDPEAQSRADKAAVEAFVVGTFTDLTTMHASDPRTVVEMNMEKFYNDERMARFVLGRMYAPLTEAATPAEQREFRNLLRAYFIEQVAPYLAEMRQPRVLYTRLIPSASGAGVRASVDVVSSVAQSREPSRVRVDLYRTTTGAWTINDVYAVISGDGIGHMNLLSRIVAERRFTSIAEANAKFREQLSQARAQNARRLNP